MADEYKEIAETGDNGGSKKKKIIIGVAVAVVICAAVAVVCALTLGGNDKEEYTDAPVSTEPASELTPGIENGVFVIRQSERQFGQFGQFRQFRQRK